MRILGKDGESAKNRGKFVQISRLGDPLVNEVVIPLKLKDFFNSSTPQDDSGAAPFVQDPQLAQLLTAVYGVAVPPAPRDDLVAIFAKGIPPTASPSRLGLLGGDVAGFPNGRRPVDDVVDIELRAVAGGTPFTPDFNIFPNNALGDGVSANPEGPLLAIFPYLLPPNPGNTPRTSNIQSAP